MMPSSVLANALDFCVVIGNLATMTQEPGQEVPSATPLTTLLQHAQKHWLFVVGIPVVACLHPVLGWLGKYIPPDSRLSALRLSIEACSLLIFLAFDFWLMARRRIAERERKLHEDFPIAAFAGVTIRRGHRREIPGDKDYAVCPGCFDKGDLIPFGKAGAERHPGNAELWLVRYECPRCRYGFTVCDHSP